MRTHFIFIAILIGVFLGAGSVSAQGSTTCLRYTSGVAAPSGYGAAWDPFDENKALLIRTNCPTSGNNLTFTVGGSASSHIAWSTAYTYETTGWQQHTLSGTTTQGWITGSGSKAITARSGASVSAPYYMVGYVCTNTAGAWKCGCSNTSCAMNGKWQLQAYIGTGLPGGPSGIGTQYSVVPAKSTYKVGERVTFTFSAPTSGDRTKDWVGVYRVGYGDPHGFLSAVYTDGTQNGVGPYPATGTLTLRLTDIGSMDLRYYKNDDFSAVATSAAITVSESTALWAKDGIYKTGGNIQAQFWVPPSSARTKDWIGLYRSGETDNKKFVKKIYIDGTATGTGPWPFANTIAFPVTQEGTYELRYFDNDKFVTVTKSDVITVTNP